MPAPQLHLPSVLVFQRCEDVQTSHAVVASDHPSHDAAPQANSTQSHPLLSVLTAISRESRESRESRPDPAPVRSKTRPGSAPQDNLIIFFSFRAVFSGFSQGFLLTSAFGVFHLIAIPAHLPFSPP